METAYAVRGMTCAHCVGAVTEEIERIEGVSGVAVDLASGVVAVSTEEPPSDVEIRAAVERAGYEVGP